MFLSGGKDSCYLAYKLVEEGKRILAFTANLDILSKVARKNIQIAVKDLNLDHITWRTQQQEYTKNIYKFINEKKAMKDICLQCSILTQRQGVMVARAFGIKDVYLGFNKYNHSGGTERMEIPPFVFNNPLAKEYNLKEMESFLKSKGIITDPTKTNCIIIEKIIQLHKDRFGENPFKKEIESLYNDKLITIKEKEHYERFGENNKILEDKGVKLIPTTDIDYLLKLIGKYRYEHIEKDKQREILHRNGFKFWKVYYQDRLFGVGYLSYFPYIGFSLDGYKDPDSGPDKKPSYVSGRLISDYFLKEIHPEIWTTHDTRNRAATVMCKRIGFKPITEKEIKGKKLRILRRRLWE